MEKKFLVVYKESVIKNLFHKRKRPISIDDI